MSEREKLQLKEKDAARFWAKVSQGHEGGCWEWTASTSHGGYGMFWLAGRDYRAHRIAYEVHVGPIPEDLHLDHLCRNRACVNPEHLEPVTCRENALRGETLAALHASRTHCPQGHPYSGKNLHIGSDGQRRCRACAREHSRRVYYRKKQSAATTPEDS